ncbi:MAG: tail protein X [Bryobacterales bacterium]|nr:tail protein X [Bryobacterales bacterium]
MAVWITTDGDMLDAVCEAHYGPRPGAAEAVLRANPGLAERGPVLPAGIRIELPDLADRPASSGAVRLWD